MPPRGQQMIVCGGGGRMKRVSLVNGSASLGLEKERGSIEVGKYADFAVPDKDVLELEAQGNQKS